MSLHYTVTPPVAHDISIDYIIIQIYKYNTFKKHIAKDIIGISTSNRVNRTVFCGTSLKRPMHCCLHMNLVMIKI